VILQGHYISEVVEDCSDNSSGCGLGCDGVRPWHPVGCDWN